MNHTAATESNPDLDHLNLLTVFHYVAASLMAFVSFLPVLHLLMGVAILGGWFDNLDNGPPPPREFGWVFVGISLVLIVFGLILSGCVALAGRRLQTRRCYTFCIVIAGIECALFPLITALGVFTIIVLMRPSVKALFETSQQQNRH